MLNRYLHSIWKIFDHHPEVAISRAIVSEQRKRFANGLDGSLGESMLSFSRETRAVGGM